MSAGLVKVEAVVKVVLEQCVLSRQGCLDTKFITALKAGTFLNCDVLPKDVTRASAIWGPSIPALKGRTVRPSLRSLSAQHMHCDIMFVNKQPFLVSITHPIGMVLVEHIANFTTVAIRPALRKMFGAFGSRHIKITMFTSDNERGISALAGDMSGMGVEVISVGPGRTNDTSFERSHPGYEAQLTISGS